MKNIDILFMDIDGTMTDGKIYIGNQGELMKAFDVKDGYGIHTVLKKHHITSAVITGRTSEIVNLRCKELNIDIVIQGCHNKKEKMYEIAKERGYRILENGVIEGVAYIGDDIPDIEAMMISMISGCPADAVEQVKLSADYVSSYKGGNGAVRDFIEYLINN